MAGNKELIDEIVDPIAVKQVTDLNVKIQELEATFAAAAKQALAFNSAAGGANTNSSFVKNVNASNKATKDLIETQQKLNRTIVSNSQAEVDAYNKSIRGEEGITSAVSKRNQVEGKAANEAGARSAKAIAQQQAQAAEYVRAQGIIEKLSTKLKFYKQAQIEATDPRVISTYAKKIQDTEKAIGQLSNAGKTGFDSLGNAVGKSTNYFQKAFNRLRTIANILPGIGIAGILAFAAGPLIDYIVQLDLFKSKLSLTGEVQKTLNDVFKESNKDIATQTTNLKILYEAATDVNSSMKDRLLAARELQKEYPTTFGLQSRENIINGEASGIYTQLTADIIANARAKAAAAKVSEEVAKQLDAEVQKQKIQAANENEVARERAKIAKAQEDFNKAGGQTGRTGGNRGIAGISASFAGEIEKSNKRAKESLSAQDEIIKRAQVNINAVENIVGGKGALAKPLISDFSKEDDAAAKKAAADAKKRAEDASKLEDELQKNAFDDRVRGLNAEIKLQEEADKELADLRKKNYDDSESVLSKQNSARLLAVEKNASDELDILSTQYTDGLISKKEYEAKRLAIENAANFESIDSAIATAQDLIELQKSTGKDTADAEEKLARLQIQHSKAVRDAKIKDNEDVKASQDELNAKIKELADETANFVVSLVDAGFENRKNQIQEQITLVDEQSKSEIEAVNRSLISNTDKAAKIQLIEAQADAQKKQLQREQKKADIEKAKFDKAVSIARVIEATAIAVAEYGFFTPLGILAAALGAVQIATLIATPIPAYEKGTKNAKGGTSLVGEKGAEYVITPQGATFLTPNKATLMDIPKGSTVIPHLQTARMMDVQKYAGGQAIDMGEVIRAIERKKITNGKTVISGWLNESKAASVNIDRRKQYFN